MCGVRCGVVMCNVARGLTGRRENINSQAVVAHQAKKNAPGLCKPSAPTEPLQAQQFSGPLQAQSETRRAFSSQARPPSLCGSQFSGPLQAESITRRAFASPVRPPIKAVLRAFASPQRTQPAFTSRLRPPSLTAQRFSGPLQAQSVRTEFSSFGTPAGPVWGRRQFSGPFQAQSVRPYYPSAKLKDNRNPTSLVPKDKTLLRLKI